MKGLTDEHKQAIIEGMRNQPKHKVGSHEWLRDNGYLGFPWRMDYAAVGRKLVMVEELPEGASMVYGIEFAKGCVWIEEES